MGRKRISYWKARRSGGRMTISGKVDDGADFRLGSFDEIEVRDGKVIATHSSGEEYELVVA